MRKELEKLKEQGLLRTMRRVESAQGPRIILEGREVINLCSNNYLGLADRPELKEAAIKATEKYGTGASASRLIAGTQKIHAELEERLAEFKGTESALVFNSGYTANVGIISALVGRGDVIFSDKLNHASIVDGCLLSGAELKRYPHRDTKTLEGLIRENRGRKGEIRGDKGRKKGLIVTDTIFSMDGDIAPLPELTTLAEKYGCMLMVDEAHATGVLGENGRGAVEHFGLEGPAGRLGNSFIQMGTLSKALGCFGGYVAGPKDLIDYLVNKSRAFIYTTALPASVAAAGIAALDIVEREPGLRKKLSENAEYFRSGLQKSGFDTMESQTQIMPILLKDNCRVMEDSKKLLEAGVFIHGIRPPTVPKGQARLRITVMATHSGEDLDEALAVIATVSQLTSASTCGSRNLPPPLKCGLAEACAGVTGAGGAGAD